VVGSSLLFAASPDGTLLLATGYGNNPNTKRGSAYAKLALADGRHWDLSAARPVTGASRADLYAGPMRWTCIEPLKRWKMEIAPNDSGIEWELYYTPRMPMWELLPLNFTNTDGELLADMYHIKQAGEISGWVKIGDERIEIDGFHGGRDRTFGLRVSNKIDFWLARPRLRRLCDRGMGRGGFGRNRSLRRWRNYADGRLSKRVVKLEHEIEFDEDRKRPLTTVLVFTNEDGETYRVTGESPHPEVGVYHGLPAPNYKRVDLGEGTALVHYAWNSSDRDELRSVEKGTISLDQLMRFDLDGNVGWGIFELLVGGAGYPRYPTWPAMDMAAFDQRSNPVERFKRTDDSA
jgi:hypothetical protein